MNKNKQAKTKKAVEVKDSQKISSFFKKLDVKCVSEDKDDDFQVKKVTTKTVSEAKPVKEISPKNITKAKKEVKLTKNKEATRFCEVLNDSDDFVCSNLEKIKGKNKTNNVNKCAQKPLNIKYEKDKKTIKNVDNDILLEVLNLPKEKVTKTNKNENKATSSKYFADIKIESETKSKKINDTNKIHKSNDLTNDSHLIINLDSTTSKNTEKSKSPSEKLYYDKILQEITNSNDFDSFKNSPPHFTTVTNLKKRKTPDLDAILPTVVDENNIFTKSENKIIENNTDAIVPSSPPKKVIKLINEPKNLTNFAENLIKENVDMSIFEKSLFNDSDFDIPTNLNLISTNFENNSTNKVKTPQKNFNFTLKNSPKKNSPKKNSPQKELFDDFFDESWDGSIDEIIINDLDLSSWQYCKVIKLSNNCQNIILTVESLKNHQKTSVKLNGVWINIQLKENDKINIIAVKNNENIPFLVDNDRGFIVYEPDFLISGTSIVGSLFCKRKGVLSDKFRGFEPENQAMIVGSLVHRLLQETLKQKLSKKNDIENLLGEILNEKYLINSSYASGVSLQTIKFETEPFVSKIYDFVSNYVVNRKSAIGIESIQDIEENIWCYNYGIKGKVDVSVKTKLKKILPLELKTGRASFSLEHRGQVILYTMIMTELGYNVDSGLLLYLRDGTFQEIETRHQEKRDLIMLRNELAYYLKQQPTITDNKLKFSDLPEPINHHSACQKCPYATICTTFLKRDENVISDTHPLKNLSKDILSHLSEAHIDYFIHWASLIHIESNFKSPIKELKDIWRLGPNEREKLGKSLCFLQLSKPCTNKNEPYIHIFKRKNNKNDILNSGLTVGNYIVVSSENRIAIATGFISEINSNEITVSLERNLSQRYTNQIFHIDTYESQTIFNYNLTNLSIILNDTPKCKKLREFIIDRKPPEFASKLSKTVAIIGGKILKRLNKTQQRAILKVLSTQDYLCIKGMPGTGKTATIVALIQLLVELKKSVLITSHTNSAVDNVCLRLIDSNIDILRLGSESKIHPNLKKYSENAKTKLCKTVEDLEIVYNRAQVIAVTCLGANHILLSKRTLDYCVIDESTQVLQCSVFKALQSAKTFVLIGDPEQLPPIVSNPDALRKGMNESLFERLDSLESSITLNLQYRMNKTITELANNLTYNGQLTCANENIGYANLEFNSEKFKNVSEPWLSIVLDNKVENAVIAIDTGPIWKKIKPQNDILEKLKVPVQNIQEDEQKCYENVYEAAIVTSIVETLKEIEVRSDSIGIIAPYRAQVLKLSTIMSKIDEKYNSVEKIEVNTVDQYQGRDKEVIIYSCTKSRDVSKIKTKSSFEILEDKRRLTVAITRAKHKLIIIGDFSTLKTYGPFEKLLNSLKTQQIFQVESKGFLWEQVLDKLKSYN